MEMTIEIRILKNGANAEEIVKGFGLMKHIMGDRNQNLVYVKDISNAEVSVQPSWSGIQNGLSFIIKHNELNVIMEAKSLVNDLMSQIKEELLKYLKTHLFAEDAVELKVSVSLATCHCGFMSTSVNEFEKHVKSHEDHQNGSDSFVELMKEKRSQEPNSAGNSLRYVDTSSMNKVKGLLEIPNVDNYDTNTAIRGIKRESEVDSISTSMGNDQKRPRRKQATSTVSRPSQMYDDPTQSPGPYNSYGNVDRSSYRDATFEGHPPGRPGSNDFSESPAELGQFDDDYRGRVYSGPMLATDSGNGRRQDVDYRRQGIDQRRNIPFNPESPANVAYQAIQEHTNLILDDFLAQRMSNRAMANQIEHLKTSFNISREEDESMMRNVMNKVTTVANRTHQKVDNYSKYLMFFKELQSFLLDKAQEFIDEERKQLQHVQDQTSNEGGDKVRKYELGWERDLVIKRLPFEKDGFLDTEKYYSPNSYNHLEKYANSRIPPYMFTGVDKPNRFFFLSYMSQKAVDPVQFVWKFNYFKYDVEADPLGRPRITFSKSKFLRFTTSPTLDPDRAMGIKGEPNQPYNGESIALWFFRRDYACAIKLFDYAAINLQSNLKTLYFYMLAAAMKYYRLAYLNAPNNPEPHVNNAPENFLDYFHILKTDPDKDYLKIVGDNKIWVQTHALLDVMAIASNFIRHRCCHPHLIDNITNHNNSFRFKDVWDIPHYTSLPTLGSCELLRRLIAPDPDFQNPFQTMFLDENIHEFVALAPQVRPNEDIIVDVVWLEYLKDLHIREAEIRTALVRYTRQESRLSSTERREFLEKIKSQAKVLSKKKEAVFFTTWKSSVIARKEVHMINHNFYPRWWLFNEDKDEYVKRQKKEMEPHFTKKYALSNRKPINKKNLEKSIYPKMTLNVYSDWQEASTLLLKKQLPK